MKIAFLKFLKKTKSTISGALKSIDLFGYKIVLNYKNDNEYKSKIGGVTSLILIILLILYGFNSLI